MRTWRFPAPVLRQCVRPSAPSVRLKKASPQPRPMWSSHGRRLRCDVTIDVTWLGHSTVVLDLDGVRIVTDPLLRRHAGVLRRRGREPDRSRLDGRRRRTARTPAPRPRGGAVAEAARERPGADLARERRVGRPQGPERAGARPGRVDLRGTRRTDRCGSAWCLRCITPGRCRTGPTRPTATWSRVRPAPYGSPVTPSCTRTWTSSPRWPAPRSTWRIVPIAGWGPRLSPGHLGPEEAATALPQDRGPLGDPGALEHPLPAHHGPVAARLDALPFAPFWTDVFLERRGPARGLPPPCPAPVVLDPSRPESTRISPASGLDLPG